MIAEEARNLVESACRSENNAYGYGAWTHHIESVVKYSKALARKTGGDEEICELGALFHDYSSVLDKELYPEHHIHSARLAGEVLYSMYYPEDRIKRVQHCILAHRASKNIPRETLEAEIVASSDAMAHFDNVASLLYLAYTKHEMGIDEGRDWVLGKLERSWEKLMPEAQEMLSEKYEAIKKALL
ncbi:MAG: HD domain-containing protein [Candidatus Aenigmarchaeota archaeon]|nr:HD domain-containing protein [Candidatus Aenigmarchaeota archaeon]